MRPKLGIIAGQGDLPALIVEAARAETREAFVVALEGQAAPELVGGLDHIWVHLGAVGAAIEALHGAGCREVVFAGAVRRPSLLELRLDARAARMAARSAKAALGDDGLLSLLIKELEGEGFDVVGADALLSSLLVGEGVLGRHRPDDGAEIDIARGLEVARAIGERDVGQAVVVQQGVVLGMEAVEGTDALIRRCGGLRRDGPGGVLVKIKKPNQERRVDLPTIGIDTVTAASEAGLRGIAIEAGATLVLHREKVIATADETGLFVVALTHGA